MPTPAPLEEPLTREEARRLLLAIVDSGRVAFTAHAAAEMKKDRLSMVDCINVMCGGRVDKAELRQGTYRYRVRTRRITVVVAFRSAAHAVVVTAWRNPQ